MILWLALGFAVVVLVAGLLYWQIIIAEGAYLGEGVVLFLYDRYANRYDRVKEWDESEEAFFIGDPLLAVFGTVNDPLLLDIGTGTGRVPLALSKTRHFRGRVIALDGARRMLLQAVERSHDGLAVEWLQAGAIPLPFGDETFDAVTCMEVLEFLPRPRHALEEMARVLRPGGILLTSNRVGWRARCLPGRAMQREEMEGALRSLGFSAVEVTHWQEDYDWVFARKAGKPASDGNGHLGVADLLPGARLATDGIWDLPDKP